MSEFITPVFASFASSFVIALSSLRNDTTTKGRLDYVSTKTSVGTKFCMLSVLVLAFRNTWIIKGSNFIQKSAEFHALANLAGYVAFDLVFSCIFCRQLKWHSILENILTLATFYTALEKWEEYDVASSQYIKPIIVSWSVYKILKGVVESPIINEAEKNVVKTSKEKLALWTIHGQDYDLESFVNSHPGGKEAILIGRGRDCTALFESYHPFTDRHRHVLKKYKAYDTNKASKQTAPTEKDEFYDVLKKRAILVLKENGLDPNKDRAATVGRTIYYLVILVFLVLSGSSHVQGNPVGSFLFAVFGWLVGAIGHDAGHFAASRIPFLNDLGLWGISFLCNPIMWQHQHTYAHHTHTNDYEKDPDTRHFDTLMRVHPEKDHISLYKNQSSLAYVILSWAFVVFGECIKTPIGMIKTGFLQSVVEFTDQSRPLRALGFVFHYAAYLALIVGAPFFTAKSYGIALLCGLVHIVTAGWLFAVFSQINHLNEFSMEPNKGETDEKLLKESWAARQVATSNNFATKSLFWHVFSNGLNMQIEHHLFPGLNHCHLHLIQPMVEQTCKEYGIHYKSFETWSDLMDATLEWFTKLSTPINTERCPERKLSLSSSSDSSSSSLDAMMPPASVLTK